MSCFDGGILAADPFANALTASARCRLCIGVCIIHLVWWDCLTSAWAVQWSLSITAWAQSCSKTAAGRCELGTSEALS